MSRASLYRRRLPPQTEPLRRRGPVGPMPDVDLLIAIRAILAASPFHGGGFGAALRSNGFGQDDFTAEHAERPA